MFEFNSNKKLGCSENGGRDSVALSPDDNRIARLHLLISSGMGAK